VQSACLEAKARFGSINSIGAMCCAIRWAIAWLPIGERLVTEARRHQTNREFPPHDESLHKLSGFVLAGKENQRGCARTRVTRALAVSPSLQLRELQIDKIQLEIGRPRTDAYIVYLFLMLRGFNGGCKDQYARLLLEESITVKLWLEHLGLQLPPASTLSDNLNAVSNQTRRLILQVQLRFIVQERLDDFQKCFIDSTASPLSK
jgi:hypothetical protein